MLDSTDRLFGQKFLLHGSFLDVPPVVSTFATPVFHVRGDNSQSAYVQSIGPEGFVNFFRPVVIDDQSSVYKQTDFDLEVGEGDAALYSFHGPDNGSFTYGNKTQIQKFLKPRLSDFESNRFSNYEVLMFLGLEDQAKLLFPEDLAKEEVDRIEREEIELNLGVWRGLFLAFFEMAAISDHSYVEVCKVKMTGPISSELMSRLRMEATEVFEGVYRSYGLPGVIPAIQFTHEENSTTVRDMQVAKVDISSALGKFSVSGGIYGDGRAKILRYSGVPLTIGVSPYLIFAHCRNRPGALGEIGSVLGKHGTIVTDINCSPISSGSDGIVAIATSQPVKQTLIDELSEHPTFRDVEYYQFQDPRI